MALASNTCCQVFVLADSLKGKAIGQEKWREGNE